MRQTAGSFDDRIMPQFLLHHRHEPDECPASYAAWKGFESPLRGRPTTSSCRRGGHEVWWDVNETDEQAALGLLPRYVAVRTEVVRVESVEIP
jgi:hypothetical protein